VVAVVAVVAAAGAAVLVVALLEVDDDAPHPAAMTANTSARDEVIAVRLMCL
jgi:hypothetical protein